MKITYILFFLMPLAINSCKSQNSQHNIKKLLDNKSLSWKIDDPDFEIIDSSFFNKENISDYHIFPIEIDGKGNLFAMDCEYSILSHILKK